MKKLLTAIIIGLAGMASATAQSTIAQLKAQYPTADAVFMQLNKSYTLNPDGSVDYHYYHRLAYLTPYAFNSQYGETFIVYNPQFQTLKINTAETLTPDGRRVASPANAFNEVLPSVAANAPAYMHLKEMVVSHTGLETGAIVTLDYVIHSKPGYSAGLFGNEVLMQASPVQQMTLDVNCPKGADLKVASFNIGIQPESKTTESGQHYRWQLKNLPGDLNETLFPASAKPRVSFTTQPIAAQLAEINKAVAGNLNASLDKWANGLTAGKTSLTEKAFAMQKGVVSEINFYPVPFDQAAYRFRTADEVFASNGGTEIEKTVLLAKLLKSQGMETEVVAAVPGWLQKNGAENPLQIARFYVSVKAGKQSLYLSALENNAATPANLFENVLLVGATESKLLQGKKTSIAVKGKLATTADNKLTGKLQATLGGAAVDEYALLRDASSLNALFGGGVTKQSYKSSSAVSAGFDVNQSFPAASKGGYHTIVLPEVNSGLNKYKTAVVLSARKTQLHFPALVDESYSYSIQPAAKWELLDKNVDIQRKNALAEMRISIRQAAPGGEIAVVRSFKLLKQDFTPEEYRQIADMLSVWFDKKYTALLLK